MNVIACLRRRLEAHDELAKITDVQNRLIMKRLANAGTWEPPRGSPANQLDEMSHIMAELVPVARGRLREMLGGCLERQRGR